MGLEPRHQGRDRKIRVKTIQGGGEIQSQETKMLGENRAYFHNAFPVSLAGTVGLRVATTGKVGSHVAIMVRIPSSRPMVFGHGPLYSCHCVPQGVTDGVGRETVLFYIG